MRRHNLLLTPVKISTGFPKTKVFKSSKETTTAKAESRVGVRTRSGKAAVHLQQQVKGQETAAAVRVCRGLAIPEDYILQIKGILYDASSWHTDPQYILLAGHVSRS